MSQHHAWQPKQPSRRELLAGAGAALVLAEAQAIRADHAQPMPHAIGKATAFVFGKEPARVRKSFHDWSEEEVRNFADAIGYMRDGAPKLGKMLPINSPLQWDNYVAMHARHCTESGPNVLQVHWSWFFLPWHRAYLFFLERQLANILATVFKRPEAARTFALPYWDWVLHKEIPNTKARMANTSPSPFFGLNRSVHYDPVNDGDPDPYNLALFSGYRGPTVDKPEMKPEIEPNDSWKSYTRRIRDYFTGVDHIESLLAIPNFFIFAGFPAIDRKTGQGLLESSPHNAIHDWVGSRLGNNRDMGTLRYAALDPIFNLHHANIDRIWSLYPYTPDPDAAPPGGFPGLTATAWKAWGEQKLEFLDIDGTHVYITVRDTIKSMNTVTYAVPPAPALPLRAPKPDKSLRERSAVLSSETIKLSDKPATLAVKATALLDGDKRDVRAGKPTSAILEIEIGEFQYARRFALRLFANKEDADAKTPLSDDHFVGSFQVMDSHAGPERSQPGEKHAFFIDVSPEVSNLFKIAPAGKPFTLRLVPIGRQEGEKGFLLNVTKVVLRVYE
jgi:polyphenol oxidase